MMKQSLPVRHTLIVLMMVLMLLLSACGGAAEEAVEPVEEAAATEVMEEMEPTDEAAGGEEAMAGMMLPEVDPLAVDGDIVIAGSSTVYPLAVAMASRFEDEGYAGQITIDEIGSGAGFERFCVNAETDIANASRAIKEEEAAACEENGRTPIEFRVGTDALAIVVNTENPVEALTLEQLAQIYSGQVTNWTEVGVDFDAPISLYSPGTDSGTFDFFVEVVLDDDPEGLLSAANIQFSEDDNVLVNGVVGDAGGIGYFGYAYYQENADSLKILDVEGVEPSFDTAESGDYPLSRPLFMYSDAGVMAEKPQVASFLNFTLTYVNEEIEDVGYFPASDATLEGAMQSWLDAMP